MSTFGVATSQVITSALQSQSLCDYIPNLADTLEGNVEPVAFNGGMALQVTDPRGQRFLMVPYSQKLPSLSLNCYGNNKGLISNLFNNGVHPAPLPSSNTTMAVGAMRKWRGA